MQLVSEPVEIVKVGFHADKDADRYPDTPEGKKQLDADREKFGRFVDVKCADGTRRRYSLDKSVNGEVKPGQTTALKLSSWLKARPVRNDAGNDWIAYDEKLKCIGIAA